LKNNYLLLGGTGTLGKAIIKSKLFKNLKYPSSKKVNILSKNKIESFLVKNKIDTIIHGAAMARVKECEENKKRAYKINVIGTKNVVDVIKKISKKNKKKIKLIFMSSDGVYASIKGNHKESDNLKPYNYYGLTKVKAEQQVKKLDDYLIIRTRFFNKNKIKFVYSAKNIFTSALEVNTLVKYLYKIIKRQYSGILNIGGRRISDYERYFKFNKKVMPCDKSKIFNELNFKIATDASLNLEKFKKLL